MTNCSIDIGIDGSCDLHDARNHVARKQHVCDECKTAIKPGDKYEYVFGVWDGVPRTQKTCRTCQIIRDQIMCSWYYGEVWTHLSEVLSDDESVIMCAIDELDELDPDENRARQELIDWVDSEWFD